MNYLCSVTLAAAAALMLVSSASAQTADTTNTAATTAAPATTSSAAPAASARPAIAPIATAQAEPDADEVICESEAPPTGSLIGARRTCMTRRQWKAKEAQTQIGQDLHRMSMGAGPAGNN
jgi:hypothetical protein